MTWTLYASHGPHGLVCGMLLFLVASGLTPLASLAAVIAAGAA